MKILFIADVFGKPGRRAIKEFVPQLREEEKIDLVIANAENSHHGKGVSNEKIEEMLEYGCDIFTSGNHIWRIPEIKEYLKRDDYPLLRPANYPEICPGRGHKIVKTDAGLRVLVINVMGNVFMPGNLANPFWEVDRILKAEGRLGKELAAIIVDMHAEAGSEKMAIGHFLDGRVSAVLGSHTHIPTADEQILVKGTAFQADVGMTGPIDSVIGVGKETVVEGFLSQMPVKHDVAEGKVVFNSTLVEVNDKTGLAKSIKRIQKFLD